MLDTTFSALSDPTRRGILEFLAEGDLSVGELVEEFSITQSAVSRHLQVLEHAGLVTRRREGQRRLCRLQTEPLREATDWIALYQKLWDERLDRLGQALEASRRDGGER